MADLALCWKNRLKMLVFDRLGFPPLPGYFYHAVHYTASLSILIQLHKCLECLGLSLAEYARYSPLLSLLPFVLYTRLLHSDAGVQDQEYPGDGYFVEIPDDQDQE